MSTDIFATIETGMRVVIRYRLPVAEQGNAGEQFSDALGVLLTVNEAQITVQTRTGQVSIERKSITHAKEVPPAPQRRGRR
ncbi:hypothetical protein [Paeniglutamicibacter terrestris]|uniref:Histone acetyltransferase Rv0428c-like SH3 domain-containing protein n=1 Tax=Paeniglutamicibacter terrestris TaxID=2723403 RepID=A0ABX1G2A8_9MICC|nr:hypothetical protein [Paeniglutamicibacter terrestris]NKG20376.1 hypothetical protein [Paeniglutamicibacter terrestris]